MCWCCAYVVQLNWRVGEREREKERRRNRERDRESERKWHARQTQNLQDNASIEFNSICLSLNGPISVRRCKMIANQFFPFLPKTTLSHTPYCHCNLIVTCAVRQTTRVDSYVISVRKYLQIFENCVNIHYAFCRSILVSIQSP